jgi:hypothetical protein
VIPATVSRNASPTRESVWAAQRSVAVSMGASPKCHSTVAPPRKATSRSRCIRQRSPGCMAPTGTRPTAHIASAKPRPTEAAADSVMSGGMPSTECRAALTAIST